MLPVELFDNLTDSLGSSGAGRDDVVHTRATCTPVLARGTIYSLLCSSDGVHSGHQALNNPILLVDDLNCLCEPMAMIKFGTKIHTP